MIRANDVEETRYAYKILVGNPEGKRPLGRSKRRWKGSVKCNIKM